MHLHSSVCASLLLAVTSISLRQVLETSQFDAE
jgi:hypothetical protein